MYEIFLPENLWTWRDWQETQWRTKNSELNLNGKEELQSKETDGEREGDNSVRQVWTLKLV